MTTQYDGLLSELIHQGFVTILEGIQARPNVTRLCTAARLYNTTKQRYTNLWQTEKGVGPTLFTDNSPMRPDGMGTSRRD